MNSMHNSLNGPGGYSGTYSGYVPPQAALPYYNGYTNDTNQCSTPYYGKPGAPSLPPNYGIGSYASSMNNSVYYQQYGIGYQYGYGKYGIGYPNDPNVHHPNINTMQPSASTDLGPIGTMFSKNKFAEGQSSSSPHSGSLNRNQSSSSILSPATSNTPSPGPQSMAMNYKGATATPSPPVDPSEAKKDLEKMKKCHICAQVFHLMSECLAHIKAVHDSPSESYAQHLINQGQSSIAGNCVPNQTVGSTLAHTPTRYGSSVGPDSPLTALEKMGWGEKQSVNQIPNQLTLVPPARNVQEYGSQYPLNPLNAHSVQQLPTPINTGHLLGANTDRTSIVSTSSQLGTPNLKALHPLQIKETSNTEAKQRKSNSYSVSSIMGKPTSLQRNFTSLTDSQEKNSVENEISKLPEKKSKQILEAVSHISDNIEHTKTTLPKENKSDTTEKVVLDESTNKQQNEDSSKNNIKNENHESSLDSLPNENSENFETPKANSHHEVETKPCDLTTKLISDRLKHEESEAGTTELTSISDQPEMTQSSEKNRIKVNLDKRSPLTDCLEKSSNETIQNVLVESDQMKITQEAEKPSISTNIHQIAQSHPYRQPQPSSMQNVYSNSAGKPANFANWPMHVNTSFPGHYPYPPGLSTHSSLDGAIKPHGYSMQPRYPTHYQQNQLSVRNTCGPDHPNCTQIHTTGRDQNIQGFGAAQIQNPPSGWYPNNSRNDGKPMWGNWSNQQGGSYSQGFYGYPVGTSQSQRPPGHMHSISNFPSGTPQSPSKAMQQVQNLKHVQTAMHIPQKQVLQVQAGNHPLDITLVKRSSVSDGNNDDDVPRVDSHVHYKSANCEQIENSSQSDKQNDSQTDMEKLVKNKLLTGCVKKSGVKIGPKSKTMSSKQVNSINEPEPYGNIEHENDFEGDASQSAASQYDSSDSEVMVDKGPTYAILKPLRKRKSFTEKDDVFVGPKRIKLAKLIHARQKKRQRFIQEQIHQSEIEERLQAERAEKLTDEDGPLANIILQSSIILGDKSSTNQNSVAIFMASMNAERRISSVGLTNDCSDDNFTTSTYDDSASIKRTLTKKSPLPKVFHNNNSVLIKHSTQDKPQKRLRAKDFKWSHFIKTTRYWCNDCAQGFKNQKEANSHTEDKCKLNCLYMLECYVVVKDVQNHPDYGQKVQVLLEEYQIDGNYECPTCGDVIARKADLLVHTDTHKDFMPWECTICGTRFKIRGSLKEHLRYTHMKGRVPCLKCNKVFPTSTLLRQHVKVHTQHYKYKSGKNRKDELRVAMEATAGAIEPGMTSPEENDRLSSQEATEYRSWCKLMEMNAMKNIATYGTGLSGTSFANNFDEDFDEKDDENMSCDDMVHLDGGHGDHNGNISS